MIMYFITPAGQRRREGCLENTSSKVEENDLAGHYVIGMGTGVGGEAGLRDS